MDNRETGQVKGFNRIFWMKLHAVISALMLPALLMYSLTGISMATGLGQMPKPPREEAGMNRVSPTENDRGPGGRGDRHAGPPDRQMANMNFYYKLQMIHKAHEGAGGKIIGAISGVAMLLLGVSGYLLALKTRLLRKLTIISTGVGIVVNILLILL